MFWVADRGLGVWVGRTSVMDVLGCWSLAWGLGWTYLCHGCFGLLIGGLGFGFDVPLSWMFWVAGRWLGVWVWRTSVMDVLGCWSLAWGWGLILTSVMVIVGCWSRAWGLGLTLLKRLMMSMLMGNMRRLAWMPMATWRSEKLKPPISCWSPRRSVGIP